MRLASVFWNGTGWRFADAATHIEQPGTFETLDDAIKAVHAAGLKVRSVAMTRGAVAERREEKKA